MDAPTLVAILFVAAGTLVAVAAIGVAVVWLRSGTRRARRRLVAGLKGLRARVGEAREEQRRLVEAARRRAEGYQERYVAEWKRELPVRDLRAYGAENVRWSALEDAGVTSLLSVEIRHYPLTSIHGIGEVTARRVRAATRRAAWELESAALPPPDMDTEREMELVHALFAVRDHRVDVAPRIAGLERLYAEIGQQVPGAWRTFWRWCTRGGDGCELRNELETMGTRLEADSGELLAELEAAEARLEQFMAARTHAVRRWEQERAAALTLMSEFVGVQMRLEGRSMGQEALDDPRGFGSEEDFDERAIAPLLDELGLDYTWQKRVDVYIGSSKHTIYADFFVSDEAGPLTIFEDKLSIRTDSDLEAAAEQGKSYALHEAVPSVVVASPEGLWVYAVDGNELVLRRRIEAGEVYACGEELVGLLREVRGSAR